MTYSATAPVKLLAGTAAAPGVTFTSDTDTGLFSPGANQVAVTTGGVQRLLVGADGSITPSGSLLFPLGSATAPSIAFTGDTNTGMWSPAADTLAASTNGSERLRIDSSGRLLVGTSTARANFFNFTNVTPGVQIEAINNNQASLATIFGGAAGSSNYIFARHRGGIGGYTAVQAGDIIGRISFQGGDGSEFIETAAILSEVDGTPGANDMPGRLVFSTTADGAATPTERLRIDSAGQIEAGSLGTAAAPVWSFLADPDTGLYSPGANQVAISTAGVGRVFVRQDGNVGIGISNPSAQLHINLAPVSTGTTGVIAFGDVGGYRLAEIEGFREGGSFASSLIFRTQSFSAGSPTGIERVRITSGGGVGIGTSTPDALLTVNGTGAFGAGAAATPSISFTGDLDTGVYSPGANQVAISTAGTQKFAIDSFDGNPIIETSYPMVRPTLDLNFAATRRLDPRVTFSRASTATVTGSDGVIRSAAVNVPRFDHNPVTGESLGLLVEEARTNSYQYSSNFDNSYWAKSALSAIPNSEIAPDGTITACRLVPDTTSVSTHYLRKDRGSGNPATETFTVYAKSAGYTYLLVYSTDTGNQFRVNLTDGSIDNRGAVVISSSSVSTQSFRNGWWKISYSVNSNQLRYIQLVPVSSGITSYTQSFAGDGSSGVLVWGAQIEPGSFPTSYIPTPATFTGRTSTATFYDASGIIQTAASGVARSNAFFPDANGVMRPAGLLLEAAGTNLVTYSEQFNDASWVKTNAAVTANASTSPDGTLTADLLYTTTTGVANAGRGTGSVSSAPYTASIYLKSSGFTWAFVYGAQGNNKAFFNLVTGTVGTLDAGITASISSVGNGWYRCSVTQTVTSTNFYVGPADSNGSTTSTASGTSGILVWGAQVETGTYPTSYIPTVASTVTRSADTSTSATVTRSADLARITGTNFSSWYNQSEGTIITKIIPALRSNLSVWTLSDGTTVERMLGYSDSAFNFYVDDNSSNQVNIGGFPFTVNAVNTSAAAYKLNNFNYSRNGSIATVDTSGSVPTPTRLQIMAAFDASGVHTGTISRLTYYPVRLPDATLQTLTR